MLISQVLRGLCWTVLATDQLILEPVIGIV